MNFTIGENFGNLLQEIAQDHVRSSNFDKAVDTIKSTGCPVEYILPIVFGFKSLDTNVETQELVVVDRKNPLDLKFVERRCQEIDKSCNYILLQFRQLRSSTINLDYDAIFNIIKGQDAIDIIEETEEYNKVVAFLTFVQQFVIESEKFYTTWKEIIPILNKEFGTDIKVWESEGVYQCKLLLDNQLTKVILPGDPSTQLTQLDRHLKAIKEIETIEVLKPTNELKDAGWISPEGNYYGLNGEISNFLHLQIADFLWDHGLIPKLFENNPEDFLNQEGWVKQQGNLILTDAYYYNKEITEAQIDKVVKLTIGKHPILRVGLNGHEFTPAMLKIVDPLQFKLKIFKI